MDINIFIIIIQFITVFITLVYVILISKTITTHKNINQKILFNEIIKQERELRIKLNEYREEIQMRRENSKNFSEIGLDYDTLLFNYYEYLALCIHQKFINEKETKLYFKESLKGVKEMFELSLLFEKGYAKKEQYPGIRWLFKTWEI